MSISAKQLAANRRNAQKSTGPKTPEGKARSSQNALKHGAYAKNVTKAIRHLNKPDTDYYVIKSLLLKTLKPKTKTQGKLILLLTDKLWRIKVIQTQRQQKIKQLLIAFDPNNNRNFNKLYNILNRRDCLSFTEYQLNSEIEQIADYFLSLLEKRKIQFAIQQTHFKGISHAELGLTRSAGSVSSCPITQDVN